MSRFDFIFVGSSPNALAGAARLAKAALKVAVVDTRQEVGGPMATETFAPGFRADLGIPAVTLDPEIVRDLGVRFDAIHRTTLTNFSERVTLDALPELPPAFASAIELVEAMHKQLPGDTGDVGSKLGALSPRAMHEVLRLSFLPARDYFAETIASEPARALLAGISLRGSAAGPFASGTLFGLLHHAATGDAIHRTTARGGVQKIAAALADAARNLGVEIRTGVPGPISVDVDGGIARGVKLGDGGTLGASAVISDHDARHTLSRMVSQSELEPEANRELARLKGRGTAARVHLALSALPKLDDPQAWKGTIAVAPNVAYLERAWDQGKRGVASIKPYIEATIPSLADPSAAPDGRHVLDAWVQHVPYKAANARDVAAVVIAELGLEGLVLHQHVSLPEDLEARFGLSGGHLYGGELSLEQCFFLRPHETPIPGLYLGGSAAHPGGYSGRSGWNLAGLLLSSKRS